MGGWDWGGCSGRCAMPKGRSWCSIPRSFLRSLISSNSAQAPCAPARSGAGAACRRAPPLPPALPRLGPSGGAAWAAAGPWGTWPRGPHPPCDWVKVWAEQVRSGPRNETPAHVCHATLANIAAPPGKPDRAASRTQVGSQYGTAQQRFVCKPSSPVHALQRLADRVGCLAAHGRGICHSRVLRHIHLHAHQEARPVLNVPGQG